jgi:uncharacterized protein
MKRTIVLGASPNPERYAYKATKKLKAYGYEVIPVGIKKGEIEGITIQNDTPQYEGIDTITLVFLGFSARKDNVLIIN